MIPTRFKSKLPKTLSFPLGAEAISEALAGVPHVEDFLLSFSDAPLWPASEFKRLLRDGLPYTVFAAEYNPAFRPGYGGMQSLVESGWYDARWSLRVNPVLREVRHLVGQLLREQGLPAVVEWLRESDRAGWDTHQHRIELVFSPAEGTLTVTRKDGA
jgi:hypothetical protein